VCELDRASKLGDKENKRPDSDSRHSTAKKLSIHVEEVDQLTMAHVPQTELESSALSFKTGNVSTRSLAKSSRSKKKHEKKSVIHYAKMVAT